MKADYKTFGLHNQLLSKLSGYNGVVFLRPGYQFKRSARNLNRSAGNTG